MPAEVQAIPDTYYVWEPPNSALTILLNLRLVDAIKSWIQKASEQGEEVGGILMGRIDESSSRPVVTIENCEPFQISHQKGPTYTLTEGEKAGLRRRIAQLTKRRSAPSLTPVGLFRSHGRRGLYLDTYDLHAFQETIAGNVPVFLLVSSGPQPTAGFFFPESADMRTQSPYLAFPFDREQLEGAGRSILRAPAVSSAPVLPKVPTSAPIRHQPLPATPPVQSAKRVYLSWPWVAAACAIVLALLAGLWYLKRPSQPESAANLGLNVQAMGRALRLTWNTNAPVIRDADRAELLIRDGQAQRRMDLNRRQIAHGSALYVPVSSDVNFQLQLNRGTRVVSDSIWSVAHPAPSQDSEPGENAGQPQVAQGQVSAPPEAPAQAQAPAQQQPAEQANAVQPQTAPQAEGPAWLHEPPKQQPPPPVQPRMQPVQKAASPAPTDTRTAPGNNVLARRSEPAPAPKHPAVMESADRLTPAVPPRLAAPTTPPEPARSEPPQIAKVAPQSEPAAQQPQPPPEPRVETRDEYARVLPPNETARPAEPTQTLRRRATASTTPASVATTASVTYVSERAESKKVIDKIPLLGRLHHSEEGDFEPARVVSDLQPYIPRYLARQLPNGDFRLELMAIVDKQGRPIDKVVLSPGAIDDRLVRLASDTIDRSHIEPARLKGREVPSRMVFTFHFHNISSVPSSVGATAAR